MFGSKTTSRADRLAQLEARMTCLSRSQAIVEFAPDGTVLGANENFLVTMGYRLEEVAGRHHVLFMPPGAQDQPEYRAFWEGLRSGGYVAGVFERRAKGGREVWLQASYNPVRGPDGKVGSVIKVAADVTQARVESAEHESQVRAINRSQATIEFSLDGTVLSANANFLRVMGYELAEIVGRKHAMFVTPSERESAAYGEFWRALGAGEFRAGEFRRLAKGGRDVWLSATYNPILDPNGAPLKVIKFATDVTAEKTRTANYEGQIRAIDRSQAVIEFSLDGIVLWANENFLRAAGYSLEEVRGQHHRLFVDPAERETSAYREFWAGLARGEWRAGEFRRIRRNKSPLWLRASYNAILNVDGKPVKVVKIASDVTAQAEARDQFRKRIGTVAGAAQQLSSSITEISTAMARSQTTADNAVQRVASADESTQRLNGAAQAMGRVVELIGQITQQINLLALNATIESARAGEAGRGFAVVAHEVKNLANQARKATDEITTEISGIRAISSEVVGALTAIKQAIGSVSSFVTSTAAAVEEQTVVTETISANMQAAAEQSAQLWAA